MRKIVIAGFGEVMLRLCPPGKKRFAQALPGTLDATYGGGEANVCASLAMLGSESRYLTALPENPVSRAFATELRGLGVDVTRITWSAKGRMGVYYAEHGAAQRGSNVVYDREGSTISLLAPEEYDFDAMLEGVGHLHLTGITPSLSENAFLSTLALAEKAAARREKRCSAFREKRQHFSPKAQCFSRKASGAGCRRGMVSLRVGLYYKLKVAPFIALRPALSPGGGAAGRTGVRAS